jgi:hypothetical protein
MSRGNGVMGRLLYPFIVIDKNIVVNFIIIGIYRLCFACQFFLFSRLVWVV